MKIRDHLTKFKTDSAQSRCDPSQVYFNSTEKTAVWTAVAAAGCATCSVCYKGQNIVKVLALNSAKVISIWAAVLCVGAQVCQFFSESDPSLSGQVARMACPKKIATVSKCCSGCACCGCTCCCGSGSTPFDKSE